MEKPNGIDILGNAAVLKFSDEVKHRDKKLFAEELMKNNKSITSVLEKTGKFKGRLRKQETKHLAGEKTKEVLYRENGCVFRFNIDTSYFSPRLSNERKEVANEIKKNENVLVMFAGVAPFPIVIAKNSNARKVVSVEINREASKYAKMNVERNKLKDKVEVVQGDVKRISKKFAEEKMKFDVIVMPRPQLKESFLKEALILSKKGTRIYYYGFCRREEINEMADELREEIKSYGRKVKVLKKKIAGEIAPYRVRLRIDFKVLN